MPVRSLGLEDPLEEEMATHSSVLAWRIPWTGEPGRLQSMGSECTCTQHSWRVWIFSNRNALGEDPGEQFSICTEDGKPWRTRCGAVYKPGSPGCGESHPATSQVRLEAGECDADYEADHTLIT